MCTSMSLFGFLIGDPVVPHYLLIRAVRNSDEVTRFRASPREEIAWCCGLPEHQLLSFSLEFHANLPRFARTFSDRLLLVNFLYVAVLICIS